MQAWRRSTLSAKASLASCSLTWSRNCREIESLIPAEVAALRGRGYVGDDDDEELLRPGDSVYVRSRGDMGDARVVSVKGETPGVGAGVVFGVTPVCECEGTYSRRAFNGFDTPGVPILRTLWRAQVTW